ncbi:hypothetical protein [Kitasatospora purpeofusca]|uniref:hypothetical protein n=1 Tax=Kitasatospora purpeofusca TaxID=67352 RepID=UPI00364A6D5E
MTRIRAALLAAALAAAGVVVGLAALVPAAAEEVGEVGKPGPTPTTSAPYATAEADTGWN